MSEKIRFDQVTYGDMFRLNDAYFVAVEDHNTASRSRAFSTEWGAAVKLTDDPEDFSIWKIALDAEVEVVGSLTNVVRSLKKKGWLKEEQDDAF